MAGRGRRAWGPTTSRRAASASRHTGPPPADPGGGTPSMNVLVVDDELKNAELVAAELRDAGFAAQHVGGGAAALQRLEAGGIDAGGTDPRPKPPDGRALPAAGRPPSPQTPGGMRAPVRPPRTARAAP